MSKIVQQALSDITLWKVGKDTNIGYAARKDKTTLKKKQQDEANLRERPMRPYIKWLIDHNLKFLVYVLFLLWTPIAVLLVVIAAVIPDLWKEISSEFISLVRHKKENT